MAVSTQFKKMWVVRVAKTAARPIKKRWVDGWRSKAERSATILATVAVAAAVGGFVAGTLVPGVAGSVAGDWLTDPWIAGLSIGLAFASLALARLTTAVRPAYLLASLSLAVGAALPVALLAALVLGPIVGAAWLLEACTRRLLAALGGGAR